MGGSTLPLRFTPSPLPVPFSTPYSLLRTAPVLQATYTCLAPIYDALVPHISSQARSAGRRQLAVREGERVLDVGTGTGLTFKRLVAANPTGWTEGVDRTPAMLQRARQRMRDVPHACYGLRLADATALPYPDDTFDAVFSTYLIDVLPSQYQSPVLQEMRRVLRPAGRVVLVYLAPPRQGIEYLWNALCKSVPPLFGGARPVRLRSALQTCGFDVQAHITCSQKGLRSAITQGTLPSNPSPTPENR